MKRRQINNALVLVSKQMQIHTRTHAYTHTDLIAILMKRHKITQMCSFLSCLGTVGIALQKLSVSLYLKVLIKKAHIHCFLPITCLMYE